MKTGKQKFNLYLVGLVLGLLQSTAFSLDISDIPLFLRTGATPNIILSIDDSGSMERGYVPDSVGDTSTRRNSPRFTASSYNGIYYNPKVTYTVPTRTDGVSYSTSFTAAYVNGFDTSRGSTNLSSNGYRPIYRCEPGQSRSTCIDSTHSTPGAGGGTTETAVTYTYTCRVVFDDRGNNNDRLTATNCSPSMPATGAGSPEEADNSTINVSGATGGYSKNYTVSTSSSVNGGVRINLPNRGQITNDSTQNGVTLSWVETTTETVTSGPAYYHLYYTDKPGASRPSGCNDSVETNACYIYVQVGSASDIAAGDSNQKKQNFAIWYSFYRTRALATMSAAMMAVTSLAQNQVRLGWQTLNNGGCNSFGTTCRGYDGVNRENRIRSLDALKAGSTSVTHRKDFYDWIARLEVGGATPLRSAMQRSGEYFSTTGRDSPYAQEPYVTRGVELSCRRNFHVLMTDGLWNSDSNVNFGGNVDSTAKTLPDGTSYSPRYPFREPSGTIPSGLSYSNTLSDIAFKYWSTDLVNLENNLTSYIIDRSGDAATQYWNPKNNPATWQHMVNFTISFGLGATLTDPAWGGSTFSGDYSRLAAGTKYWPPVDESAAGSDSPEDHVYDLWHAAINSRGEFFNADDPAGVANAFQAVFNSIITKNPSSAALAANSTSIQAGTMVYQARYDSSDWHGELKAIDITAEGLVGAERWDASQKVPPSNQRNIFTWNGTAGATFNSCSAGISSAQRAILDRNPAGVLDGYCDRRMAWLRGDATHEARNGGDFRDRRVSVLGDIVNSAPVYVKNEDHGYGSAQSALTEKSSYSAFVATKSTRLPMVYVGANDGMLHGFRADAGNTDSGKELLAFIPAGVYSKLPSLMERAYAHTYLVDGSPVVGDAYWAGSWKTILVSGLGAGGKSIFALDVTAPQSFAASNVLWEYQDTQDLGLTLSQPQIGRAANGQWVAVFGNGVNSQSGRSYLYVVNLATGALIRKIQAGTETANGLSTPVLYDSNGDKIVDAVYAGDLKGNLWKFDLTSTDSAQWGVANGGAALFVARNQSGQVQPIMVKPAVTVGTGGASGGAMVLFGTGSYISSTDPSNTEVQSFYGIWDNGQVGTVAKSSLRSQAILAESNQFGRRVRETSNYSVDWSTQRGWYLDLVPPGTSSAGPGGERVIYPPIVRYDRVIFVTMVPDDDPCTPGGKSWLMELDFTSGSRTVVSVFDFVEDGVFNNADLLASGRTASGVGFDGIATTPTWLEKDGSSELAFKLISGVGMSGGGIESLRNRKPAVAGAVRRVFWQQLR